MCFPVSDRCVSLQTVVSRTHRRHAGLATNGPQVRARFFRSTTRSYRGYHES